MSAPVPVPFLWTLDFGFGTWFLDLDLGLEFGSGLGLENKANHVLDVFCCIADESKYIEHSELKYKPCILLQGFKKN